MLPVLRHHGYVGRFAPSPSGPLHAGSLVAAMASYLDARAHGGRWLLRIEDIDTQRVAPGADTVIINQLRTLGMAWGGDVVWQSRRRALYQQAFDTLAARQLVYGCACTRQEIDAALCQRPARSAAHAATQADLDTRERRYPGTCRQGLPAGRNARAWRFRTPPGVETFSDRWQGLQEQDVEQEVGDFVLKRADGLWAYQLAVVVDDGEQAVTHVVRGDDLLSSTARQRVLQRHLGLEHPAVMHVPVVRDEAGHKLSKQNHAAALDCERPLDALNEAWQRLGFPLSTATDVRSFWDRAIGLWAARFEINAKLVHAPADF